MSTVFPCRSGIQLPDTSPKSSIRDPSSTRTVCHPRVTYTENDDSCPTPTSLQADHPTLSPQSESTDRESSTWSTPDRRGSSVLGPLSLSTCQGPGNDLRRPSRDGKMGPSQLRRSGSDDRPQAFPTTLRPPGARVRVGGHSMGSVGHEGDDPSVQDNDGDTLHPP